jgi:hypothetical protein
MIAYKLVRRMADGKLSSLFVNKTARLPLNTWMRAENHAQSASNAGLANRPGWHCTSEPKADHLTMKGRVWVKVEIAEIQAFPRPEYQGGTWLIAEYMRILEIL